MAKPANPAIIIGLGGTGQWVLTYVKKNLLDTYGEVPPTVKLLSFDTTSEKVEAKLEKGEEHARVGNVQLETGEFIYLGGNIRTICEEIKRGQHSHIGTWLQADYYLGSISDDEFQLFKGAGQRRPFGRMAVFYDLLQGQPDIIGRIDQAITDVMNNNEKRQDIEVYVVCSLAGGTGSGMFIDISHIARQLVARKQVKFAMRAFLVLQNAFTPVLEIDKILANSFAATRELDRFLQVFDRDYPIYYADDKARREPLDVYRSIYKSKLFDNCYLLDARRTNMPLDGIKPWLGMFPSVAECITALLDPETGDTFSQHYRNVSKRLSETQLSVGKALYSSLGTFTYILPVEDMIETAVHSAALEILRDRLFKITTDEHTKARRVTSDSQRELRDIPREAAKAFLKSDKTLDESPNLLFLQQMANTLDSGNLNDSTFIGDMAVRGLELLSWLSPVEKDDAVNQVSQSIQSIIESSIGSTIYSSDVEKDDTISGAPRITRKIKEFREERLGSEDAHGRRTPGKLQKGLAEYGLLNRRRYRRILADLLTTMLNGEHHDPVIAKSGKLPYAIEVLSWMLKMFDEFDGFMKRVLDYRAKTGESGRAREDAIRTRQIMEETKGLTGVFDRLKKTAVHAQEDHIAAEDYLFQLEREDVLYRALQDYTGMFRTITEDAKDQMEKWQNVLTLGGPVGSNEPGAYNLLLDQEEKLTRRRKEQEAIKVYEYMTDTEYEADLYKQMISEKWGEVLRRFKWEISFQHIDSPMTEVAEEGEGHVRFRYAWEKKKEPDYALRFIYGDEQLQLTAAYQNSASQANARFLVDKLRPYFVDIRNQTIADRFTKLRRADGIAKEMLDNTDPLINYEPSNQRDTAIEKHNFVCVNRGVQVDYFKGLEDGLKKQAPKDQDNQVIGLTNKHRAVVLSTEDLIIGQETDPIITSRQAYMNYTGEHKLLHNFPAEVNASVFEDRLTKPPIGEARRLLSPMLVALMEDKGMLRRYVMGRVFNIIKEEPAAADLNKSQWVLRLDRQNKRDLSHRICLTPPSSEKPKELDAITEFVFVKIDKDTGLRYIRDITPDTNIQVEPSAVDEAIDLRRKAILSGREAVVLECDKFLQKNNPLLNGDNSEARPTLVNGLRRFILNEYDRYERELQLGNSKNLSSYVEKFLDDNRDCLAIDRDNQEMEDSLRKKLAEGIVGLLVTKMPEVKPVTTNTLVRLIENYIDVKVLPLRKDRDQLTHDLGSVIHLILHEEIERLERMKVD